MNNKNQLVDTDLLVIAADALWKQTGLRLKKRSGMDIWGSCPDTNYLFSYAKHRLN